MKNSKKRADFGEVCIRQNMDRILGGFNGHKAGSRHPVHRHVHSEQLAFDQVHRDASVAWLAAPDATQHLASEQVGRSCCAIWGGIHPFI
jgi:hypothetical protein